MTKATTTPGIADALSSDPNASTILEPHCSSCMRLMGSDEIGDEFPDERVCDECAGLLALPAPDACEAPLPVALQLDFGDGEIVTSTSAAVVADNADDQDVADAVARLVAGTSAEETLGGGAAPLVTIRRAVSR